MAYSVEKRAASMIKKLQRELKGTRSNLTTKRNRIKAQISRLRVESQKAQAKRAHAEPAKKAAPKARARERVKTTIAASPGVNKMSRKGYGARKLTQAEGRAALNKNTPARAAQIKRSQAAAGKPGALRKVPRRSTPKPQGRNLFNVGRRTRPNFGITR